jgi:hypothetical protein
MRLTWRDGLATVFVVIAALLYTLWRAGIEVFGMGAKGLGGMVLALGVAASVIAVVYGVGAGLLRASKVYLVTASVIGLVATVAGVATLVTAHELMLDVLMAATAVLWVMATVRHAMTTENQAQVRPAREPFRNAA